MDNLSYIAFLCIVIALGMMLPLMERSARLIGIFLIVGMFCCLFYLGAQQHHSASL